MNDTPGGVCDYCGADEGRCWDDCPTVKMNRQADEIERLREALKETLAVARRNEIGDYIQRAEALLQQKDSE